MPYTCKIRPYEGDGPYIFISYAHKDADEVLPILDQLTGLGYRIWYDDGIVPGSEWPEYIAEHLQESRMVITFVSPNYVDSTNCRRELTYAQKHGKTILAVVLSETELSPGVDLQLSAQQNVFRANYNQERFLQAICAADGMDDCKGAEVQRPQTLSKQKPGVSKSRKRKPIVIGIGAVVIVLMTLIIYMVSSGALLNNHSQTYSADVTKAVDTACVYAAGQVDDSGSAVLKAIDYCREYIDGDMDEETLSDYCNLQKEAIQSNYSNNSVSNAVLTRVEDLEFCTEALETAEECSIFEQYVEFAQNLALKTSITNSKKKEALDQLEEIVKQKYIIVLDEAYGAVLPIINDSDSEYSSQMMEYVNRTNTASELSGMINDSLFGQVYVLEDDDNADEKIQEQIDRSNLSIKNCEKNLDKIAGSLWSDLASE